MHDDSQDVSVTVLHASLPADDLCAVEQILAKAVLDTAGLPRDGLEQQLAAQVKLQLEFRLRGAWNCVVGQQFGASVNVEENTYAQFFLDDRFNVFVFKNPSLGLGK